MGKAISRREFTQKTSFNTAGMLFLPDKEQGIRKTNV